MVKCTLAVALVTALACACGSTPAQPINPDARMRSASPDDLPPSGTSGLGTPGGAVDAGIRGAALDGGR